MKNERLEILAIVVALLAGCAELGEGPYRFGEGWRRGRVRPIGRDADLPRSLQVGDPSYVNGCDCRAPLVRPNTSN